MSLPFVTGRNDLSQDEIQRRTEFVCKLNALIKEYRFGITDGFTGAELFVLDEEFYDPDHYDEDIWYEKTGL